MERSSNLDLPFIMPSQAQKHVTHNEAVRAIDTLVQLAVTGSGTGTPPASPADGERHIVGAGATGDWTGHENDIAGFQDGAWTFHTPQSGWLAWNVSDAALLAWTGSDWTDAGAGFVNPAALVGVNTQADAVNRFAVKADAALFSHDDVTPGTGDMRVKLNKAASGKTASLLFQTGWSGRAEFGLTGDDDWQVKVSADGAAWAEALVADSATGAVSFPSGVEDPVTRLPVANFMFAPNGGSGGTTSIVRFERTRSQDPRTATIGSIAGDVITLTTADADLFFHPLMRDVSYIRIWNTSKGTPEPAWVKRDPASGGGNDQLQVTDAAHMAGWIAGETIQIGDQAGWPGVPAGFTRGYAVDISPMLQNVFGAVFPQKGLTFKCSVSGVTGSATLTATASGVDGSFTGGNSLSDGQRNLTQHMVPTKELSPISDSNLVWVREQQDSGGQIGISVLLVLGVWV